MSASSLCIQINKNANSRKDNRLADEIVRYSTQDMFLKCDRFLTGRIYFALNGEDF